MIPGRDPPPWGTGPLAVRGLALVENVGVAPPRPVVAATGGPRKHVARAASCPLGSSGLPPGPWEARGSGSLPAPLVALGPWGPASAVFNHWGLCGVRTRSLSLLSR